MMIRRLRESGEWRKAESLQKKIWGFPDREIVSLKAVGVLSRFGVIALGAFDAGEMVGFCYGQPGLKEGKPVHYSRLLGVLPEFGGKGAGGGLKWKQREEVLKQGLDRICWTFDPLQARNAALNIRSLGCFSREYMVDAYPVSDNRFNRGMGSDRIEVEWPIRSIRVRRTLAERGSSSRHSPSSADGFVLEGKADGRGVWVPGPVRRALRPRLFLEVPREIAAIRRRSVSAAQAWRKAVRKAFCFLLERGYVATGFGPPACGNRERCGYTLEKIPEIR